MSCISSNVPVCLPLLDLLRMYLAVDPGLYSVNDLEAVKKGTLVDFLEEVSSVDSPRSVWILLFH